MEGYDDFLAPDGPCDDVDLADFVASNEPPTPQENINFLHVAPDMPTSEEDVFALPGEDEDVRKRIEMKSEAFDSDLPRPTVHPSVPPMAPAQSQQGLVHESEQIGSEPEERKQKRTEKLQEIETKHKQVTGKWGESREDSRLKHYEPMHIQNTH